MERGGSDFATHYQVPAMKLYIITYCVLTIIAFILLILKGRGCSLLQAGYRQFLMVPWKVVTFAIGAIGTAVIAPYSGDPTWDYYDALFMALFTFLSAPWAVGIFWQSLHGRGRAVELYIAVCAWFFSASWSYDLYILLRDGAYSPMWQENIYASSFLYLLAGLFWNLEWREGRGVTFAFLHQNWPSAPTAHSVRRILWYILPVVLLVGWLFLDFVIKSNG